MITKKSNERVRMWVAPAFKTKLKAKAAAQGFNLIDYTEKLSEQIKGDLFNKNESRKKFDFRI